MEKESKRRILAVLLNYNSERDLFNCIKDLKLQLDIELTIVIVDNASTEQTVNKIKSWSSQNISNLFIGNPNIAFELTRSEIGRYEHFLILNDQNRGYSNGNNIGAKFAQKLGIEAVLIANPDMKFPDKGYLFKLYETLFLKNNYAISGSKILGLNGENQSPIRESTFWEEFFWVRQIFPKVFKSKKFVLPFDPNKLIEVPKIMGCCFLIKTSFLCQIQYFDENVFLYSEEAILATQVKKNQKKIVFNPTIFAIHAHKSVAKGNSSGRMLLFIKSRRYYWKNYSDFNKIKLALLNGSYAVLYFIYFIKSNK